MIMMCFVVVMMKPNKQESFFDKELKRKQQTCEKFECNILPSNFNENCVNHCISKKCFERNFKNAGLEPGEIDSKRQTIIYF